MGSLLHQGEPELLWGRLALAPPGFSLEADVGADAPGLPSHPTTPVAWLLHAVLIGIYNVLWLYPAYVISFVVNCIWYKEIAQLAFQLQQPPSNERPSTVPSKGHAGMKLSRLLTAIGEEVYRIVLSAVFFIQVFVVGLIPYIGRVASVVLLSWLYGFYSFDYSWSLLGWSLRKRLSCFESNWAFFAGFGFPCTLVTLMFPTFTSAAIMAALFPQFVLMAALADPERTSRDVLQRAGLPPGEESGIGCLPIFYLANCQSEALLRLLSPKSLLAGRSSSQHQKKVA